MELKAVMEWLVTNKYVSIHNGKPKFTTLYHKEAIGIERGLTSQGAVLELLPVAPITTLAPFNKDRIALYNNAEWCSYYTEFIKSCKIPAKAFGTKGETYALNKYSEDGMKSFKQAMKDGYDIKILILAVALYYQSSISLKKAVSNYMISGEWKSDYQNLVDSAKSGNLADHIKNETEHDKGIYQWG